MVSWATIMAIQYPDCIEANQDTHCKGINRTCWDGYDESPYAYILSVPMTAALAVRSFNIVISLTHSNIFYMFMN